MIQRYGTEVATSSKPPMALAELLGCLRSADDLERGPLEWVRARTEAIGAPAAEHAAVLHWLGAAFAHWETAFPLEEPLRSELRRLKPLAAKLAITDPDFLVAGQHPLHQMLDALQVAAVGWQARLGRVGESLRRSLSGAVEEAVACFDAEYSDLAALCARVAAATQRDLARAGRMAQRAIETEQGKARSAEAKRVAAGMINAQLAQFRVPPDIGELLKGPWYDSAQLVLLKFGAESEQWAQMSETTRTLLDSLQPIDDEDAPGRRQQLFETVSRLPRELKRWLLSVQHQSEVVEQATALVEFNHMQVLRKRPLELDLADPIPVDSREAVDTPPHSLDSIGTGQWFCLEREAGKPLRVQLVSRSEGPGGLLFANQAGIGVFQQSVEEFAMLLEQGRVSKLDSGASFSRSLAWAAGIESVAELDTLLDAAATQASQEEELQREWDEALRRKREREAPLPPATDKAAPAAGPAQGGPGSNGGPAIQASQTAGAATPPALNLHTGSWLGFHDGSTPLLAKLAVHDREQDHYIFVNRSGIRMRQLDGQELLALMNSGMVDVLPASSSFRDELSRTRKKSDN